MHKLSKACAIFSLILLHDRLCLKDNFNLVDAQSNLVLFLQVNFFHSISFSFILSLIWLQISTIYSKCISYPCSVSTCIGVAYCARMWVSMRKQLLFLLNLVSFQTLLLFLLPCAFFCRHIHLHLNAKTCQNALTLILFNLTSLLSLQSLLLS